jgi:hypothetical protein
MDTFEVELIIKGSADEINRFVNEFKESHNTRGALFYLLDYSNLILNTDSNGCSIKFETMHFPSKEWLANLKKIYPSFKVTVFWHNIFKLNIIEFIGEDGTEYVVDNINEVKELLTDTLKKAIKFCVKEEIASKMVIKIPVEKLDEC